MRDELAQVIEGSFGDRATPTAIADVVLTFLGTRTGLAVEQMMTDLADMDRPAMYLSESDMREVVHLGLQWVILALVPQRARVEAAEARIAEALALCDKLDACAGRESVELVDGLQEAAERFRAALTPPPKGTHNERRTDDTAGRHG